MFRRSFTLVFVLFAICSKAQAVPLFDMQVGVRSIYSGYDAGGNTWNQIATVQGKQVVNGTEYFVVDRYNYERDGAHVQMLLRSTDNQTYLLADDGSEIIPFQIVPIGTTWTNSHSSGSSTQVTLMGIEEVAFPYAGETTRNAYVFRSVGISASSVVSPYWDDYIVPGLGIVKEVDYNYYLGSTPAVQELVWIDYAPVPEPSSFFLLGAGLAGAGAFRRWAKRRQG